MECSSLAAQWEQLGGYLGLERSSLHLIRGNHPLDNVGSWNEALNQWIKQNYKTEVHGMPSWRTLVKAIARVDRSLFKKLAIEHGNFVHVCACVSGRECMCMCVSVCV